MTKKTKKVQNSVRAIRSWVARYTTICGLCDEGIDPGEDVVWFEEEVVHVECARDEGVEVEVV